MFCGEHLLDRVVYDKTNSTKNDEANDSQDYFVLYYSKTGNKRKGVKDMDFNINDFQSVARATRWVEPAIQYLWKMMRAHAIR